MAGLLSVGQSALLAAYAQLQTTGHNIANANTPGYSRQEAVFATAPSHYTGGGFLGSGVDLVTVQRRYDQFLSGELSLQTAAAAAAGTRAEMLGRVDSLLADTDNGLGAVFDEFNAALADLVNRPFDPSARQAVLMRADTLAHRLSSLDGQLRQLGAEADQRVAQSTGTVNRLLDGIAQLNERIAQASASGHTPNGLLDERDAMLVELNGHLKANAHTQADGTITVFAASGEGLVVGNRAARLVSEPDPADNTRQRVVLEFGATRLPMSAGALGGGSIAGLLQFRDNDLQAARARLGQMAAGLAGAFNAQQAAGVDAQGAPGQPMFALGRPEVLAASGNGGSAAIAVKVIDGMAVAASDYSLAYDGSVYTVTRLSDGVSWQHAGLSQTVGGASVGLRVDGLEFELLAGGPAAGDRFTIRSATALAAGMANLLSAGSQLASGQAMSAARDANNAGDLSVAGFEIVDPHAPGLRVPVVLSYNGSGFDVAVGTPPVAAGTLAWTPGETVEYQGWKLSLTGTPQPGDSVAVTEISGPAHDNRNARAMLALADRTIVGGAATFSDAFAGLLVDAGTRVAAASAAEAVAQRLLGDAQAAQAAHSGVNLDEEAARLMQYQQMYQAAARVIQAAQSMFDALLGATAR